jgi:hypothetical protein
MKSAYELAMERLEKQSPSAKVTEEQKREIAEIESTYRARIAEKELFLTDEIKKARIARQADEVSKLERQLASEVRRLNEDCESKKEKARQKE